MIRLMLVDDHEMVRLGLSSFFSIQKDFEVVAEATDGKESIKLALKEKPDIILMDLVMEVMDGTEATIEIMKRWPEAKIIILTSFIDDEKVYPAMEAGASGYILKTSTATEIAQAVRETYNGHNFIEDEVSTILEEKRIEKSTVSLHDRLTSRENDVVQLIAKGYTNQAIADELFITLKTVKTHVSNILSKLEVEDRTQVAIYAFRHDLVEN
ncbi:MAG: response regulator transcription factor [Lactococcus lactis]|uniref:response regulator transcription factor n=1 Tax=Alkalibacterium TaxID=99906 RepID=UPI002648ABD8|nr:response regulator transcription factor [Alkalibacterium sp.]MDN6390121.1 response regulator transcription factor [Lactococcus lactis]MDN6194248.1 response regulator transcription factor [Alkalibacterium sp.]MDN6294467.1 response regulator transcription factor [Alkalibacterium sp.]MDN6296315.1 response regulator transcription factor [Alkalibacterium sp.]MDN6730442.1 response regulator transcription factor [Alkalibacterium sp.]